MNEKFVSRIKSPTKADIDTARTEVVAHLRELADRLERGQQSFAVAVHVMPSIGKNNTLLDVEGTMLAGEFGGTVYGVAELMKHVISTESGTVMAFTKTLIDVMAEAKEAQDAPKH